MTRNDIMCRIIGAAELTEKQLRDVADEVCALLTKEGLLEYAIDELEPGKCYKYAFGTTTYMRSNISFGQLGYLMDLNSGRTYTGASGWLGAFELVDNPFRNEK